MLARNIVPTSAKTSNSLSGFLESSQIGGITTRAGRTWTSRNELQKRMNSRRSKMRMFNTGGTFPISSSSDSPVRISHLLGVLLVFGIGATSWGLYEFYSALTVWPNEVRGDLRAGLRAKQRGDMKLAQRHLTRAWETIQSISPESLSPDPYLKLSGVAVVLAEVLEAQHQLDEAFPVLETALSAFTDSRGRPSSVSTNSQPIATSPPSDTSTSTSTSKAPWTTLSTPLLSLRSILESGRTATAKSQLNSKARMRAVALALKLGELSEALNRPEEEERWLGFAVTEVLRLIQDEYGLAHDMRKGFVPATAGRETSSNDQKAPREKSDTAPIDKNEVNHNSDVRDILSPGSADDELGLPAWVSLTKTELAAPMERLGAYYARQGKVGNAITLYRVASSLLVHPKAKSKNPNDRSGVSPPSIMELCQALQIENAHMALMMDVRRSYPEEMTIQRDLPRVLSRAVRIYDDAVRQHGHGTAKEDNVTVDTEIALCDETYPAVLYNAGVYYEEEGQLELALRSYSLSYTALRRHGPREMMHEALESVRRLQRAINKNGKQAAQVPQQNNSLPSNKPLDNSDR